MMIDKIMKELWKKLEASVDEFIEIRMKKSGNVVIITPDGPVDDNKTPHYEITIFSETNFFIDYIYSPYT